VPELTAVLVSVIRAKLKRFKEICKFGIYPNVKVLILSRFGMEFDGNIMTIKLFPQ
jgi:hypothetical protein